MVGAALIADTVEAINAEHLERMQQRGNWYGCQPSM